MNLNEYINVKNRGTAEVGYALPDNGVRRTWTPGEVKKGITIAELEQLTFIPGGMKLLEKYLVVNDQEVCEYLGIKVEPEYFYDESTVLTLLEEGTLDQLYDCLDFAPGGVLDLIKKVAVEIKLNDVSKRQAIQNKLGFNISSAIENIEYASTPDTDAAVVTERRSEPVKASAKADGGRRTTPVSEKKDKYKRVDK